MISSLVVSHYDHLFNMDRSANSGSLAVFMAMFLICCFEALFIKTILWDSDSENDERNSDDTDEVVDHVMLFLNNNYNLSANYNEFNFDCIKNSNYIL